MNEEVISMDRQKFFELLAQDLANEWTHLRFYLYHASAVTGLHRHEYKELFMKEAQSEMLHVQQFSDFMRGLSAVPHADAKKIPSLSDPKEIIAEALRMEQEVVDNYAQRIQDAQFVTNLTASERQWIEIFFEGQIEHSRADVDEFRQILLGL